MQLGSLSFGAINTTPLPDDLRPGGSERLYDVAAETVDIDLLGANWASIKLSHANGRKSVENILLKGREGQISNTYKVEIDMRVHRYPRLIVAAAGAVLVYEVGVALAAALSPLLPLVQKLWPSLGIP